MYKGNFMMYKFHTGKTYKTSENIFSKMFHLECTITRAKVDITGDISKKSFVPDLHSRWLCTHIVTRQNRTAAIPPETELRFSSSWTHHAAKLVLSTGTRPTHSTPQPLFSNKNLFRLSGYVRSQNNR